MTKPLNGGVSPHYGSLSRRFGWPMRRVGLFRDRLLRLGVEGSALLGEDAAFYLKVAAEGVADEIEGVVVPRFEVHRVYVVTSGAVDDAADAGPEAGHGAHAAGLQRAVQGKAFERIGLELGAEPADDDHLRVRCRVVAHLAFIEAGAKGCIVPDEHRADLGTARCLLTLARLLNGEAHEVEILRGGHAGLDAVAAGQPMVQ